MVRNKLATILNFMFVAELEYIYTEVKRLLAVRGNNSKHNKCVHVLTENNSNIASKYSKNIVVNDCYTFEHVLNIYKIMFVNIRKVF